MRIGSAAVLGVLGLGLAFGGPGPSALPLRLHSIAAWGVPAADQAAVYALTRDHRLVSVDLVSGRLRWVGHLGTGSEVTAGSTVLLGDSVVVAGDFELFGFDRDTGVRRWQFRPLAGYGVGLYMGGMAGGVVFTGSPSGRLFAIDAADGRVRWITPVLGEQVTVFTPTPVAGGVAAGYTDLRRRPVQPALRQSTRLTAACNGERAFHRRPGQGVSFGGGPVAVDDLVVAASSDGTIYALDSQSGVVRWMVVAEASTSDDFRPMTLSGRILVVGSLSGSLTAIDVDSRRVRWRRTMVEEGSVAFRIHSDRNAVYAPYASGKVVALEVATGNELWRAGSRATRFDWPPALAHDRLFLTSEDGLYVLPKSIH